MTATATFLLPIQESVRDLLASLLGRGVAVDKSRTPLELADDAVGLIADFVTDDDQLALLCVFDHSFAIRAGASIVMVPSVVADEALRKTELPDELAENAVEVINVMARLLNGEGSAHVRLRDVYVLPQEVPEEILALRGAPAKRKDFSVTIEGYGAGRVSLFSA